MNLRIVTIIRRFIGTEIGDVNLLFFCIYSIDTKLLLDRLSSSRMTLLYTTPFSLGA